MRKPKLKISALSNLIFIITLLLHSDYSRISYLYAETEISETVETIPPDQKFKFKINGDFRELFTYTKTDEYTQYLFTAGPDREKNLIANLNRIRFSPEFEYEDKLLIHIDYDNEIITGNFLKSYEFNMFWRPGEYNDLCDLSGEPHYSSDLLYRSKVHNAYAKLVIDKLTATIGRQQIRFGSGRLWNPLDILNPISPMSVEGAEEQKGTDALRLEYYPGESTEIAVVFDPGRKDDKIENVQACSTNIITRFKTTIAEADIALLGGRVTERTVGGGDVSAVLFDGILSAGLIWSNPEEGRSFYQGNCGFEYNFKSGIYFLWEYFYNQNALNYNENLKQTYVQYLIFGMKETYYRSLSNQFLTYNQHYSGLALGYDITALLRGEIFTMYDFQGRGLFTAPSLRYNVLQNVDISLSGMIANVFKHGGRASDFDYLDKYGLYFASLTWYF
ncbi:MAG: hypothetical protein MUC95_07625 [Spirochaetes bacterium]|jgi:hypothetical protein|nr:hypothetical protein [Spirochaetota bacterium]